MLQESIPLVEKLISIRSIPGDVKALEEALGLVESVLEGYTIERFEHNGVKSILVYREKERPKSFKVILNGHLDIIPAKESQYVPHVQGDRLYGAGAMDMKANLICLVTVFKKVADKVSYPLALQVVTDEEVGGFDGTRHQVDEGVRTEFVLAGEPTNFDIVHQAKGVLWVKVTAQGKTAHGAYPWAGDNAILKMITFLDALQKKYPLPTEEQWTTTINVGNIETSNKSFNKIPDHCEVSLDIRHVFEESDTLLEDIRKMLPVGCTLEVVADECALLTDTQNRYVKMLEKASHTLLKKDVRLRGAQGSSDARHFRKVNGAGVEFGPIGGGIGSDDEWVDIPSLETYCQILEEFLLSVNDLED